VKLRRPSPALLISCLALFISLGGVSYGVATGFIDSREVKNNTLRTQDLRNNDVRGKDIRNSTIGGRDVAFNTLTGADINESRLTKVPDADKLDGLDSAAFVAAGGTPRTLLTLSTGTTAAAGEAPPSFEIDALGYVHLSGVATKGAVDQIAELPAGARPASDRHFVFWRSDDVGLGDVNSEGDIVVNGPATADVSLDGITFKAGG
jgi:hypothetical protein